MRLRRFGLIVTLALGLLAAPLAVEAQKAGKVYRIGILRGHNIYPAFLRGSPGYLPWLADLGYVEGKDMRFEPRSTVAGDERLAELAAELVRLKVDVIATEGMPAIRAAQLATKTIPIVMVADGDPVRAGFVASLARPGGNITGVTTLAPELNGKRLQLLKEAVPGLRRVAVLWNPVYADRAEEWNAMQAAARGLEVELQSLEVRSRDDFESAFNAMIRERAGALLVLGDPLTFGEANRIIDLATKNRLPSMCPHGYFVTLFNHGLMSYAPNAVDVARRTAALVDKILKGSKPADLPVERPTKFEFVINLTTAKALGVTIPPSLLYRADRVIR